MEIRDGKLASQRVKDELKSKIDLLKTEGKKVPHLAAVLVGNDGASETYVASKVKNCEEIGIKSTLIRLAADTPEEELVNVVQQLNADADVNGILVQLPLPKQINEQRIIHIIHPDK